MEPGSRRPRIAVVGGGIAGLVAARRARAHGADVVVLEASERLGGQIRTITFEGLAVDVGAEALHSAAPAALALVDELGLTDRLVAARAGPAHLWFDRGLKPLPAGVGPAGPTRLGPVLRARVLSPWGIARAGLEPAVARPLPSDDTSVGAFVARHFGREVVARLVDPLLGSLHAGDVDRLSLRAATPQLAALAGRHRSLLLAHRARTAGGGGPGFVSFAGGLVVLVDAVAEGLDVRLTSPVLSIEPAAAGYRVHTDTDELRVDAVVLALPAHAAARCLRALAPAAADGLTHLRSATVATVVASYPREAAARALRGNGLLVPSQRGTLLKAATFLSAKWDHLDAGDRFLVRLSAGRAGSSAVDDRTDEELVAGLHADLVAATGLAAEPLDAFVTRWPRSIAQLEVGHLDRLAAIRAALAEGVVLAGAPYEGIGIASCVTSAQRAAERVAPATQGAPT